MATDSIRRTGPDPIAKADSRRTGYTVDPGPYEAIVVGTVEGTRLGQLKVSIPDFHGLGPNPLNREDQIIVNYASPFFGTTFGTGTQELPDSAWTNGQSYGMWMIPPDVGCKVLVIFVAGDLNRGYWFACVYDTPSHHMVPGIARNIGGPNKTFAPDGQIPATRESVLPVVEYNTTANTAFASDGLESTPRRPHEWQSSILVAQGLDKDPVRGAISSSSLRESPSNVYGISTPGRRLGNPIDADPQAVVARRGGHQFVMDDGDANGIDQLIRLRTSGGHQLLMNDTEGVMYLASSTGMQYIEFGAKGAMHVYSMGGMNFRSQGVMNLHSDVNINMCAPIIKIAATPSDKIPMTSLSMTSDGTMKISSLGSASLTTNAFLTISGVGQTSINSGAKLNISAVGVTSVFGSLLKLNSGKPGIPSPVTPTTTKFLPDVRLNGRQWVSVPSALRTVCSVAPTHEPFDRKVATKTQNQYNADSAPVVGGGGEGNQTPSSSPEVEQQSGGEA